MSESPSVPLLVEEVAPGVTRIALPLPGITGGVNVHLVRGDGPTTLVDSAMPLPGAFEALEAGLADAGASLQDLELVLLTHHHLDHTGLAGTIHGRTGVPLAGLPGVADAVADPHALLVREVAWGEAHIARHGAPGGLLDMARQGEPLVRGLPTAPTARVLAEGDVVRAGDHDLVVRHRPGHSPTDTLFVSAAAASAAAAAAAATGAATGEPATRDAAPGGPATDEASPDPAPGPPPIAFVGDHLFRGAPLTPVLGSMLGADGRPAARYLAALEETAAIPGLLALPGHGPALPDPAAVVRDRRGALDRRTGRVRDALGSEPQVAWDLGVAVWRGVPSVRHGLTRLGALLASLELLEDAGEVVRHEDDGRVTWTATGG